MGKKKPGFSLPFDNKWLWGSVAAAISTVIIVPMIKSNWDNISRVWAAPKEIDEVKHGQELVVQQTTQIGKWVEQQEKERELQKKAPPGFKWDEVTEAYLVWKDDPRLKKK